MDTKAFAFKSQARYQAGGQFKEKAPASLSLINQQIVFDDKGSHFQAMFSDVFADFDYRRRRYGK